MVFIAILGLAAVAAQAAQSYQSAKASDQYNQMMVDINNKAAMKNYRRNLEKFSERRVQQRKSSLIAQGDIASQYISVRNEFAGTFADNWGQSAELFARSIARRAGEDREQQQQNLQREIEATDEAQEQARLDLTTQLKAPGPETAKAALLQGIVGVGFSAAALPSNISIARDNELIRRAKLDKQTDTSTDTGIARPKTTGANVIVASS